MNQTPTTTNNDKFITLDYRIKRNSTIRAIFFSFIPITIIKLIIVIFYSPSYLIFTTIFAFVLFYNYIILKKRCSQYLSSFKVEDDAITLYFYHENTPFEMTVFWRDFDFCFGRLKEEKYLVIAQNSKIILKLFESVADHHEKFDRLRILLTKYVSKHKSVQDNSNHIFSNLDQYSKDMSLW